MNIGRIFANAVARRVAYVLVAAVLAWFGLAESHAGDFGCPTGAPCSRDEAYAKAVQHRAKVLSEPWSTGMTVLIESGGTAQNGFYRVRCGTVECYGGARDIYYHFGCPAGHEWDEVNKTCGVPCSNAPPTLSPSWAACPSASADSCPVEVCSAGCKYWDQAGIGSSSITQMMIDGVWYIQTSGWVLSNSPVCTSSPTMPDLITPPADTDGDGTSDGNDSAPHNPGQSGDGTGEDGSSTCGGANQPACNGNNEGSGRGNTSGGGGNCDTPPRSTGDAILAQIAFQTWATRCALEGNANAGNGSGNGSGQGDGDQPGWTKGNGPPVPTDDTDYVGDQTRFGLGVSTDLLDQENIFGNASCPVLTGTVYGHTWSTADIPMWCQIVTWLGIIVPLMGAWTAINILTGRWFV